MFKNIPFNRVEWVTSGFLIFTALLTFTAVPAYLYHFGWDWFLFGVFLFYYIATGTSITLGYHRLFSHKAFKAKWPVKLFVLLFGAAAFVLERPFRNGIAAVSGGGNEHVFP